MARIEPKTVKGIIKFTTIKPKAEITIAGKNKRKKMLDRYIYNKKNKNKKNKSMIITNNHCLYFVTGHSPSYFGQTRHFLTLSDIRV